MEIQAVGDRVSTWGEGPIWSGGKLVYVDIEKHEVIAYDPTDGSEQTWPVGERVGTVVPRQKGGFVIAGDRGFSFLDDETGELEAIGDPEPDKENNRFNDGKCSPDGYFFAGTISLVKQTGDADLYRLSPSLEITKAYGPVTNSNGLAWAANGQVVYYVDTPNKNVLAFDYEGGELTNPREVVKTCTYESSPDGMTIDAEGKLWIAFCHGACVIRFDPETGEELQKIDLPCLETTACAFGGEDLTDLYVTTGIHKTEKEELAGRLLVIKGLGIKGVPANQFKG